MRTPHGLHYRDQPKPGEYRLPVSDDDDFPVGDLTQPVSPKADDHGDTHGDGNPDNH